MVAADYGVVVYFDLLAGVLISLDFCVGLGWRVSLLVDFGESVYVWVWVCVYVW